MAGVELPMVGNVSEAGDIVLVAYAVVIAVVVGLALLGIDAVVGRLRRGAPPGLSRGRDGPGRAVPGRRGASLRQPRPGGRRRP